LCSKLAVPRPLEDTANEYHQRLRELGFATSGRVLSTEAMHHIADYFAPISPYIPGLCPPNAIRRRLNALWTNQTWAYHPVRHILLQFFLDELATAGSRRSPDSGHFGEGPWDCLNPIADHYRDQRITQIILQGYGKERNTKAAFRCPDCGYTYRR